MIRYTRLPWRPFFSTSVRTASTAAMQGGRLAGKVAIVTASTDGIGLAIAQRLGEEGAQVVVSSRKAANVQRAVEELQGLGCTVMGVPCHVSKGQDRQTLIDKTVEKFGGLDILVSNAAVNPTMGGVLECSEEAWDKIFEVNVKNALQLSQLAVPHIQKRKGGAIVYVSSIAGYQPMELLGAYSVSKTALLGLSKAVAQQLAPDNIRVNCVAPGIVKTKFSSAIVNNPMALEKTVEMVPLGRIAEPKEMAGVVAFLCSDDASYITGESFVAAGGMFSRL
ncbi:dehydrogenase/reductase SDR family member 4-like isoform X1 [Eriocheir sinensis]|uniref:dehydrogenase/reductase SDR family member 4-like isoform X1 n=2 Tax=Eriocheir sinensis TaxID=95602 RepID=UPI0021C88BB8|nr:dehydrogenase/reductase SDR family member 4-like isoform X1 [Eriocheir sinensis]